MNYSVSRWWLRVATEGVGDVRLRDFPRLVVFAATLAGGARGADALERAYPRKP